MHEITASTAPLRSREPGAPAHGLDATKATRGVRNGDEVDLATDGVRRPRRRDRPRSPRTLTARPRAGTSGHETEGVENQTRTESPACLTHSPGVGP